MDVYCIIHMLLSCVWLNTTRYVSFIYVSEWLWVWLYDVWWEGVSFICRWVRVGNVMFKSYEVECEYVSFICGWVGFGCVKGCDSFICVGGDCWSYMCVSEVSWVSVIGDSVMSSKRSVHICLCWGEFVCWVLLVWCPMMWWCIGVWRGVDCRLRESIHDESYGTASAHSDGEPGVSMRDGSAGLGSLRGGTKGAAAALSLGVFWVWFCCWQIP